MWVLLEFFNDYDQHGGYFSGVFATKEDAEASVDHIGRRDFEYSWYEVEECEVGKMHDCEQER